MSGTNESPSTAVERAIEILETVAQRDSGMSNSEISRRLSIPKSSASYILRTLEHRGYLRRERGTGKYRLGLKVLSLGRAAQKAMGVTDAALPVLRRLVEETELTAHVAVLDHGEAVYVEKVESPGFIKMDTWIGRRMEVHSTAVGKALVANLSSVEVETVIAKRGLRKRTSRTITTPSKFIRELSRVRQQGFAVDDEENSTGVRCVAAPVLDNLARAVAAVGLSGTTVQIDKASLARAAKIVTEAAREISEHLGYRPESRKR